MKPTIVDSSKTPSQLPHTTTLQHVSLPQDYDSMTVYDPYRDATVSAATTATNPDSPAPTQSQSCCTPKVLGDCKCETATTPALHHHPSHLWERHDSTSPTVERLKEEGQYFAQAATTTWEASPDAGRCFASLLSRSCLC